ncbi:MULTISPECIES: hypothetical protein [unclassified Sphingomonas]|jgi:hypothetical protein|uniref:hypothetical protein n=1 Tax=unclassified Sphingomonas TaxID=196159 RepID=UPI0025CF279B|nr:MULTISPECIES: hypothetical protein [unclassified Sphingomonas]
MVDPAKIDTVLDGLSGKLAAIEHERWSHWQKYMHAQCEKQPDGSLRIPAALVSRWEKQAATEYGALSEKEQSSDLEQVNRYLPLIADAFKNQRWD